jgi:hypothetical protein
MPNQDALKGAVEAKDVSLSNPLGVPSTYANDVALSQTMTDLRLIFNEIGPELIGDGNKPTKVLKANVVVPFQLAEALANGIIASLQQHKANLEALANAKKPQ